MPKINACGEIVFSTRINQSGTSEEIFLYDNGRVSQLTENTFRDAIADINDDGTAVWTEGADGFGGGSGVVLQGQELTTIGVGSAPAINNLGRVAWKLLDPAGCAFPSDMYFFD